MKHRKQSIPLLKAFIAETVHRQSDLSAFEKSIVITESLPGGLIRKHVFSESYVIGVLGINRGILLESRYNGTIDRIVLREHLLFEGWWDSAKDLLGDSIENIKKKATDGAAALKIYGNNAKGVVAAFWSAVQDPKALDNFKIGLASLMSKRVASINKLLYKIEKKLIDFNMPTFAKGFEKLRGLLASFYENFSNVEGWKGLLTAAAGYLGFAFLLVKFSGLLESALASDTIEEFKRFVTEEVANTILETIKDTVGQLGGKAIEALSGPMGWLKTAYEVFEGSAWVLDNLMSAVSRGNFAR
jgi:hypothetical protein